MLVAHRFEGLLDAYRRLDGSCWTGQQIDQATGVVIRSYVTNLRKGRIENPGLVKIAAIALAIGFPPEETWFEDVPGDGTGVFRVEGEDLAVRVENLFGAVRHPGKGEPPTRTPTLPA